MPASLVDAAQTTLQPPPKEPVATYTPSIAQAKEATATSYTPEGVVVDSKDTVQGQLKTILDDDSVLMQQARTRAAQDAQARGLTTSSIAVGDAQARMNEIALPIAQQDASTYFTGNTKTVDAKNAALNFGAAAKNQAALTNATLGTDVSKANAGMINEAGKSGADAANAQILARMEAANRLQLGQLDATTREKIAQLDAATREKLGLLDADTRMKLGQLDSTTRVELANIDARNRQLLQTNQSAAQMFNQTVTDITNISTNPDMSPDAKRAAVQSALNLLQEGMSAVGGISNLDLSQYFTGVDVGQTSGGAVGDPYSGSQRVSESNLDWQRYFRDNPDVQQWASGLAGQSPEALKHAAWQHYVTWGKNEGRDAYSA